MWAILTDPTREGNRWTPEEFFATGQGEIDSLMARIDKIQHKLSRGRALDFGCGLGRLTQALCRYFQECHGVDIAASMVEGARRFNRFGDRCHYHVNTNPDLRIFPDNHFDLVYTVVVLQHMQPRYIRLYIREFLRILRPGGLAAFQIPTGEAVPELPESPVLDRPLPPQGLHAEVTIQLSSLFVTPSESVEVPVRVRNISPVLWIANVRPDQRFRISLGNHWLAQDGAQIQLDDGRAPILMDMPPGAASDLVLTVQAPATAGNYQLELDMVQEVVGWFGQRGSKTVRLPVEVRPASAPPPTASEVQPQQSVFPPVAEERQPFMEMYALSAREVFDIADSAGAKLIHLFDDSAKGGLEMIYYVTK